MKATWLIFLFLPAFARAAEHPRLYFTKDDLPRLRELRKHGVHQVVWENMRASADWALTLSPRKEWIAPVSPDPVYENLYDRFYAIMGDLAITEHLAFAYAISGERRFGDAARAWTLASCLAWRHEADAAPDGGKAYAVSRLLKGIAVGYDAAYDCFSNAERDEIRATLTAIASKYSASYFTTPTIAGEPFHTHHATVEWSSFGVTALALLGESPDAQKWLDATVKKFETHLLPLGLAPDGAQVEGATFWASTMQYRLFFMDPLRRVTGKDLFKRFEKQLSADYALATIAAEHRAGDSQSNASIILSPSYGQLDYVSPVLLQLAREYHHPVYERLALWDHTLGAIQRTRFITPHRREQLCFALGPHAYLNLAEDSDSERTGEESDDPAKDKLSFHFPSVDEAYARNSYTAGNIIVGVRKGELVIHCGTNAVLIDGVDWRDPPTKLMIKSVEDNQSLARITCEDAEGQSLIIELHRPSRLRIRRRVKGRWTWTCHGSPARRGDTLTWEDGVTLTVTHGAIAEFEANVAAPPLTTAFGKLRLADPSPEHHPRCTHAPAADEEIDLEVREPVKP